MPTSPHPKLSAILAAVGALSLAAKALFDGDPATNPDWSALSITIALCYGLFTARQNNQSSEDVGVKPKPPVPPGTNG